MTSRIIALVDMDCFYVQVEERDNPHIKGVPAAVVQYNSWKGGGIIAVNYEARGRGVTRQMRGDQAKECCPEIQLVQVPVLRGKANLTKYRDAGREVISVLCQFSNVVERASVDEAYIDLTEAVARKLDNCEGVTPEVLPSTWVVGYDKGTVEEEEEVKDVRVTGLKRWMENNNDLTADEDNVRLSVAAMLCEEMRAAVLLQTGFKCSAGISNSKMLSKLACGLHKPNQQTILPPSQVAELWTTTPIRKVRNLGGKLGESLKAWLGCNTMADLRQLSLLQLQARYDHKTSAWLVDVGSGIDREKVTPRQLPKSIGCGKNFNNKDVLNTKGKVRHWMNQLAEELSERLEEDLSKNKRRAKTLTVGVRLGDEKFSHSTRSCYLPGYSTDTICSSAMTLIQYTNKAANKHSQIWSPPILNISLSADKFEETTVQGSASIQYLFKKAAAVTTTNPPNKQEMAIDKNTTMRKSSSSSKFKEFFQISGNVESKLTWNPHCLGGRGSLACEELVYVEQTNEDSSIGNIKNSGVSNPQMEGNGDVGSKVGLNPHHLGRRVSSAFEELVNAEQTDEDSNTGNVKNSEPSDPQMERSSCSSSEELVKSWQQSEDFNTTNINRPNTMALNLQAKEDRNSPCEELVKVGQKEKDDILKSEENEEERHNNSNNKISEDSLPAPKRFADTGTTKSFFKNFMMRKRMEEENTTLNTSHGVVPECSNTNKAEELIQVNYSKSEIADYIHSNSNSDSNNIKPFQDKIVTSENRQREPIIQLPDPDTVETSNANRSSNFSSMDGPNSSSNARQVLAEMFPDLNDVDPTILDFLPDHIQEEYQKMLAEINGGDKCTSNTRVAELNARLMLEDGTSALDDIDEDSNSNARVQSKAPSNNGTSGNCSENVASNIDNLDNLKDQLPLNDKDLPRLEEDMVTCPECEERIWVFDMVEHTDYHMAVKLRLEQRVVVRDDKSSSLSNKRGALSGGRKRGRKPKNCNAVNKHPKLDSYFKSTSR